MPLYNPPGSGAHPDLATHDTLGLTTQAELDTHAADTSSVHGITDSTVLATDAEVATAVGDHSADTTAVHGLADTSVLATDTEVATAVSDHSADTTAVHGITDTAALSLDTHDHDADYEAAGGIATHSADTTAVHGIADTSAVSLTSHDHDADYEATGAVATHAGLADPHTGYQKESEKSAASGYASLDAGTKVPIAELPTGTSGTTVALGDAAAGLITTHEGAANPHPTYETAAEVLAQIGTHEGLANPHPGYLTPAEGDAAYDALGAAAAAAAASQPLDSDLTAIAALTTTAFGRGLLALADAAALGANHTHAGGLTLTPLVQSLGAGRRSGTFDITGLSGLTIDKPVLVMQTAAPIASKGNAREEMEFDAIQASGYVVDATTIRVYWNAPGVVVGDYAFGYTVSG